MIVTRDRDGEFARVRQRLPPPGGPAVRAATDGKGSIRCSYHAWTYGLDGRLLATPRVDDEFDRDEYGLWPHHAKVWNGMVFVSVADQPTPLDEWLRSQPGTRRVR